MTNEEKEIIKIIQQGFLRFYQIINDRYVTKMWSPWQDRLAGEIAKKILEAVER